MNKTATTREPLLDILRGLAILGIFYFNIWLFGGPVNEMLADPRSRGWTLPDQVVWATLKVGFEGTARGLLQLLFGAGMLILTAKFAAYGEPVVRRYARRMMWLFAFGLFDVFVLLWPGDILHVYAIAALLILPLRRLPAEWLMALGLTFAIFTAVNGGYDHMQRTTLAAQVEAGDPAAVARWNELSTIGAGTRARAAEEAAASTPPASAADFARYSWHVYTDQLLLGGQTKIFVFEAFCTMLIGMALWKWGVLQGAQSTSFYARLMVAAYAIGLTLRAVGAWEATHGQPWARTSWMTNEFARLAVTLGHVALVNLALRAAAGRRALAPFAAAGRTAFSLYFMQQVVALVLFAPFALALWDRFGYAGLAGIATFVVLVQLVIADRWLRHFDSGPVEWLWRWLATGSRPPFRRIAATPPLG